MSCYYRSFNGVGGKHIYSETEQAVGTWVDGSTVYEKTFLVNNLSGNVYAWTNFAQLPDVNKIVSYEGCAVLSDGNEVTLGYYVLLAYLNGNLRYYCKEITTLTFDLRLTIRYTKVSTT